MHQAHQGAEKHQQGENGKQEIICQGGAVPGHIMGIVPVHQILDESKVLSMFSGSISLDGDPLLPGDSSAG